MPATALFSSEKFKTWARSGQSPEGAILCKELPAAVEADVGRELTFVISTGAVDREGDTIAVEGWDFRDYLRNPVVLWAHDYRGLPIGRTLELWTEAGKVKARVEFVGADVPRAGELAEAVYQLYRRGFLHAVSVGFLPRKWAFSEASDRKFGIDFAEQELLDLSAVPVPANPEALIARARAIASGAPGLAFAAHARLRLELERLQV